MMLLLYYITYCLITNIITQAYSPDANESTLYDYQHIIDDPALGMHEYVSHFKSFHFEWNNANEWTWSSSHNHSMNINESIACSKQNPSLCIHTQFTTNTATKQIESFKSLTIHYKDTPLTPNKIALDFWNDLDWSQVNIIHHHDTNDVIDRRHLLSGALTAKYDNIYYMYDDDNDEDDFDEIEDMYNIDNDYDEFLGGLMKKLKSGLNTLKGALGGRIGVYARPPCSYKSRCRVHLYGRTQFRKRLNKYGHFCEGRWDRWRLKKYHVKQRKSDQMFQKPPHGSVSSVKVQGSPCCVMIAYDKYKFKGKRQGMFPRGRYPSMRMGIATSRDTRPREITEMDKRNDGFKNDALRSMVIVHDCYLRQKLMRRAIGRATRLAMPGPMQEMMQMMMQMKVMFPSKHKHHLGPRKHRPTYAEIARAQQKQLQQMMHSMMSSSMANQAPIAIPAAHRRRMIGRGRLGEIQGLRQTMQMMQMAKMMFPNAHRLHHHHRYWRHHRKSYAQIARDQQNQMQQMMHMMMMSAMANQAPITIPSRRRIMGQGKMNNMHVVGVRKCKLLDYTEICVTFDAVNSKIGVGYTVKDRREIKTSDGVTPWERMESLVELFEDVDAIWNENEDEMDMNMDDHIQGEEEEEETFDDIEQWVDPATNSDPLEWFANRYYDHGIMPQHTETKDTHNQNMDSFDLKLDAKK
eukprot:999063_1